MRRVTRIKPRPEPYLRACRSLGWALGREPGRCVAIEDTPTGIRSALAAGMRVVAVCHTFGAEGLGEAHRVVEGTEGLGVEQVLGVEADGFAVAPTVLSNGRWRGETVTPAVVLLRWT